MGLWPPAEREPQPEPKPEPEASPRYGLNSEWEPRSWFDWSVAYIADFATSYSYSYQAELDAEMSLAMAQDEVPLPSYLYDDDGTALSSYSYDLEHRYNLYNADGTPLSSYSYEDDGTAWPSYSYDLEHRYLEYLAGQESKESKKSKKLNRQYDEAVQRLEKSYTSPIHDGADWWNWELGPSPSPDPETHHGDQHGWAAEWYRLWGEMQRKQQAEIEARLQASRVEKFYNDFMAVGKAWQIQRREGRQCRGCQAGRRPRPSRSSRVVPDCVNAGYKVVPPGVLATTATAARSACPRTLISVSRGSIQIMQS